MTRDSRSFKGVKKLNNRKRPLSQKNLACVASVSNRVIARKLERKHIHFFFCSSPSFLDEPREETLATQATKNLVIYHHSTTSLICIKFTFD